MTDDGAAAATDDSKNRRTMLITLGVGVTVVVIVFGVIFPQLVDWVLE